MNPRTLAIVALAIVNVLYGLNYTIAQGIMPVYMHAPGLITLRAAGAVAVFWLLLVGQKLERIDRKDWFRMAVCGLFGVALNQTLFFWGLSLSTPINSAVMMTSNPIMVLLLSALLGLEALNLRKFAGILLGASGALWLILSAPGAEGFEAQASLGNTLVLLNAASYAIYLVLSKPLMRKYKPITVIRYVFTFGLPMTLVFGLPDLLNTELSIIPLEVWGRVAYVIVGVTILAYFLNLFALQHVNASLVSMFIYGQPLVAGLYSISVGKDHLTWITLACASLIFVGVYLVAFKTAKSQTKNLS